jgi:hypothetical protein
MTMTKHIAYLAFATLMVLGWGLRGNATTIPPVKSKTLDDAEVILPKAGGQQPLVLLIGFSHKSAESCAPWDKRLVADFHADPRVSYYQIPVLQDAPSFVRPMILRGMRKDKPPADLAHTLPVYDHEADWKKLVGFSGADDAYVVVTDPQGHIVWHTHGAMNEPAYGQLKSAVAKLLANSPASGSAAPH